MDGVKSGQKRHLSPNAHQISYKWGWEVRLFDLFQISTPYFGPPTPGSKLLMENLEDYIRFDYSNLNPTWITSPLNPHPHLRIHHRIGTCHGELWHREDSAYTGRLPSLFPSQWSAQTHAAFCRHVSLYLKSDFDRNRNMHWSVDMTKMAATSFICVW